MWFYYSLSILIAILLGVSAIMTIRKKFDVMALINIIQAGLLLVIGVLGFIFYNEESSFYFVIALVVLASSIVIPSFIIDRRNKKKKSLTEQEKNQ